MEKLTAVSGGAAGFRINASAKSWRTAAVFAATAMVALSLTPALFAQQLTGNLFGNATDEQGARLAGVAVTLAGIGAPLTATTDARGEFRFLNLAPGNYTLSYELPGFSTILKTDVQVAVGRNTETTATMKVSTVEASVTVRGEAALIDPRKVTTGATITQVELREIPTTRDPWAILQSVPGVLTDKLNIGGNYSATQSTFYGKGALPFDNVWNLDGVNVTDMANTGAPTSYYDFDSFEEINVTTGGAEITQMTPGVQLNLVTKRGTNDVHGSARVYLARKQWQSENLPAEAVAQGFQGGTRIDNVQDYGVEAGGPLWKDRVWLWGAYARNQVDLITITGSSNKATLEDANLKLNFQITDSTSATASYTQGEKTVFGRGAGVTHPPETTGNQGGFNGQPAALDKVEVSQVVSSRLFLTASYAYLRGGFQVAPVGGTSVNNVYLDAGGVWHNSYLNYATQRPLHNVSANGSYFFNTGPAGHELKVGFSYRKLSVNSTFSWPGNGNWGWLEAFNDPDGNPKDVAVLTRAGGPKYQLHYYNGYAGDVIAFGNATINAGVRYDVQDGSNRGASTAANPVIPEILPALSGADEAKQFTWKNWQPRVGVTYGIGSTKKLLLKGSYARFADQLGGFGGGSVPFDNANQVAYAYYYWNDKNKDSVITRDELDFASGLIDFVGFDPANPTAAHSPNVFAPNFKAGTTDEFIAGFDYEVLPELVVGAAYTHRKYTGVSFSNPTGLTSANFELCTRAIRTKCPTANGMITGTLADGTAFSVPLYTLIPGTPIPSGLTLSNRPDFNTTWSGIELTWQKRLSNKWMMRGNFTWSDWKQNVNGAGACVDPNNALHGTFGASCPTGGDIMVGPSGVGFGAFGNVWVNSRWNFNINGLYELPWGFVVAANILGREGYPFVNWVTVNPNDGLGPRSLIVGRLGDRRFPNVFDADLRLEKVLTVKPLQVHLSVDVFNVANAGTVLQRQGQCKPNPDTGVCGGGYNTITETLSPRVVRAGARISF